MHTDPLYIIYHDMFVLYTASGQFSPQLIFLVQHMYTTHVSTSLLSLPLQL